jgi:hypothetical protein
MAPTVSSIGTFGSSRAGRADDVAITWHSFELFQEAKSEPFDSFEHILHTFGGNRAQGERLEQHMASLAQEQGQPYAVHHPIANALDAHRVLHLAAERGVADAFAGTRDYGRADMAMTHLVSSSPTSVTLASRSLSTPLPGSGKARRPDTHAAVHLRSDQPYVLGCVVYHSLECLFQRVTFAHSVRNEICIHEDATVGHQTQVSCRRVLRAGSAGAYITP